MARIPHYILEKVKEDPFLGVIELGEFLASSLNEGGGWEESDQDMLLEAYALVTSMSDVGMIEYTVIAPVLRTDLEVACIQLRTFVDEVVSQVTARYRALNNQRKLEQLKSHFALTLTDTFGYEFTEGDIDRVQELINELRDLLKNDSLLDEGHKRRLLKRLEALQSELNKKVSDLSHFYGLMGDFGVAVGKLGTDAKPFTDRIREVIGIAWKAQARAEQLPSSAENPMLSHDGEPPALV